METELGVPPRKHPGNAAGTILPEALGALRGVSPWGPKMQGVKGKGAWEALMGFGTILNSDWAESGEHFAEIRGGN